MPEVKAPERPFRANVERRRAVGFYDLGGNVFKWMWEVDIQKHGPIVRGAGWNKADKFCMKASRWGSVVKGNEGVAPEDYNDASRGFRVVRRVGL